MEREKDTEVNKDKRAPGTNMNQHKFLRKKKKVGYGDFGSRHGQVVQTYLSAFK